MDAMTRIREHPAACHDCKKCHPAPAPVARSPPHGGLRKGSEDRSRAYTYVTSFRRSQFALREHTRTARLAKVAASNQEIELPSTKNVR